MKRFLSFAFLLLLSSSLFIQNSSAQFQKLTRHPEIPLDYESAFVDYVKGFAGSVVRSSYGQYFGQITPEGEIYGFGAFFTDQDGEVYGYYRMGKLIIGIKQNSNTVKVGSETHYTVYDLMSGEALYTMLDEQRYNLNAENKAKWKYMQITYKNGDKYVGEKVNGQREGYGIYYYHHGDFYFGRYKNNKPYGYGATFTTGNRVTIQDWVNINNEE